MVQQPQPEIKTKALHIHIENHDVGLFSHLSWVLEVLLYCEQLHDDGRIRYIPAFNFNAGYCDENSNWFDYYFKLKNPPRCKVVDHRRGTNPVNVDIVDYHKRLTSFQQARDLFDKYINIRPFVGERANNFIRDNQLDPLRTIAVHYRGSDKMQDGQGSSETAYLSPQDALDMVLAARMEEGADDSVFLATDCDKFKNLMMGAVPLGKLHWLGGRMSEGMTPVHKLTKAGRVGWGDGLDALVNVLVMARCRRLYKTPSAMSAWAKIFNVGLDVAMLTPLKRACPWFPERLLCPEVFPEQIL